MTSYRLLYSNKRTFKLNSAWTRSGLVEEFEKLLKKRNPSFVWQLRKAILVSNSEYKIEMLKRHKFEFNQKMVSFYVSRDSNGFLQVFEED